MARKNSFGLLAIFFLSVSIVPVIEMGHDFLHSFKNSFHNHQVSHKSYSSHTAGDHHGFQKMKFAHQMGDNNHLDNLVWFAYQFSQSAEVFELISGQVASPDHNTVMTESAYFIHSSPPTRPPLSV